MKINSVNSTNIINMYNRVQKSAEKKSVDKAQDSLQISSTGKSLSTFAGDQVKGGNSPEKIEAIRNEITKGTYNANSKLTAQKMVDIMKGRDI